MKEERGKGAGRKTNYDDDLGSEGSLNEEDIVITSSNLKYRQMHMKSIRRNLMKRSRPCFLSRRSSMM